MKKGSKSNMVKSRMFGIITTVCLIVSGMLAVLSFSRPVEIEEITRLNTVRQEVAFDYQIDVYPGYLYPGGGRITPEATVFTQLTKGIVLNIDYNVTSEKPVTIEGEERINVKLAAENQWERDFSVGASNPVRFEGTENRMFEGSYYISLDRFLDFIENVEEETGGYSGDYLIKIQPIFDGRITDGNRQIGGLAHTELVFSLGHREIGLIGEKTFINEIPLEESRIVANSLSIFGLEIPLVIARIISLSAGLFFLGVLVIRSVMLGTDKREKETEADRLEKKYAGRVVELKSELKVNHRHCLSLKSFKGLLKIADEKELPIFKQKKGNSGTVYYVMDGRYLYNYKPDNRNYPVISTKFTRMLTMNTTKYH